MRFAKSAGGLFVEVSAKQRVNVDSAFASIVKKTAESKRARDEWECKKRTSDGFNGNIASQFCRGGWGGRARDVR